MRELFLLDPAITFLNHGSFGACPRDVFETYQDWQLQLEKNPVEFLGRRSADLLRESREHLAAFVGASADCLVYVANATTAVNAVARSVVLKEGDEILMSDQEYGACVNTWEFICRQTGARIVKAKVALPLESEDCVEQFQIAITPRTRVLFVSHILSVTALILPVAELCALARRHGLVSVVDGAHAPGQISLELSTLGVTFYTGNCHKWLCAPKGAAFLYAERAWHERLHGPIISWGYSQTIDGHTGLDAYTGRTTLEKRWQWQGTRDLAAFLSVPAAIEFQRRHDWDSVRLRCHAMALALAERVSASSGLPVIHGSDDVAQMVPLCVPREEPEALKERLFNEFKIEVPVTVHEGHQFVRVSVQGYNDEDDLLRLERALATIHGWPLP